MSFTKQRTIKLSCFAQVFPLRKHTHVIYNFYRFFLALKMTKKEEIVSVSIFLFTSFVSIIRTVSQSGSNEYPQSMY